MHLKDIQVLLPCFDLDERVFTLCSVVQEKLQTELMHVSEQLNKLQTSQSLLQSFNQRKSREHQIIIFDAHALLILLNLLRVQLHSFLNFSILHLALEHLDKAR